VFDQDGVKDRLTCMLPDIAGYLVSPEARGADLQVQPLPNGLTTLPTGEYKWLVKKYPDSKDKIGIIAGDIAATKVTAQQAEEAVKSLGDKVVYNDLYPAAGPPSWASYATAIKEKGVKGLIWSGEPSFLGKLVQALSDINYKPDWIETQANHYDQVLIESAGASLGNEKVYVRSAFWPFEKADQNPATKKYLDLFEQYKPDGKNRTYLGLQAMSAWLLFAQSAKECGNDLTRKCVYDNAKKVSVWTGGGLHAQTDPSSGKATECFVIEEATPKGFVNPDVGANKSIYHCDPKDVYTLKGDYGKGVKLSDVGKSESDLK
jgi:ABC-type branched-subunit amino acid transport system substrate-binding protein